MNSSTQLALLFDHLVRLGRITPLQAHELYRVNSFHRRMADLRSKFGVRFRKERKRDNTGRLYVEYQFAGVGVTHSGAAA